MTHCNRFVVLSWLGVAITVALTSSIVGATNCDGCGRNARTVDDGVVFDELSVNGLPQNGRPRIKHARTSKGDRAVLRVDDDRDELFADVNGTTLQRSSLSGLTITLETPGREYELRIESYFDGLRFWAGPTGPVPAYKVLVRRTLPERADFERLCTGEYIESTAPTVPGQEFTAIVFAGDHYSSDHVVTQSDKGTFNLACFGTAAAKMHLLRHTSAGTPPGAKGTKWSQRTAMLRAITADYCGDGRAWTGDGTPLWWTDRGQLFPLDSQPGYNAAASAPFPSRIEAAWGPEGKVLCLNEPRRNPEVGAPSTSCSVPAFPRSVVTCEKGLQIPRCSDLLLSADTTSPWESSALRPKGRLSSAYVITLNPPGPVDYCNKKSPVISWPLDQNAVVPGPSNP